MKNQTFLALFIIILLSFSVKAQEIYEDVIYLKNGTILHGMIIEQVPNKSFTIQTKDENSFVCKVGDIEKITKEENENYTHNHSSIDYNKIKKSGYINITEMVFDFGVGNYNGTNLYGIQTINGYLFSPNVSLGLGMGLNGNIREGIAFIPLFADFRVYFLNQKPIIPFFSTDVGYTLCNQNNNKGGILINPSFGMKVYASSKVAINFSLGYKIQYDTYNANYYGGFYTTTDKISSINFKVGISF